MVSEVTSPESANDQIGEINKYNFRTETTGVFKAQNIFGGIEVKHTFPPFLLASDAVAVEDKRV